MAAWVVRCGRRGQEGALNRFEDNSVSAIGWGIGDLSEVRTRDETRRRLRREYYDCSDRQISNWTGTIHSFVNEISVGDLILTPSTTSSEVLVGHCEGEYEYWPQWEPSPDGEYLEDVRKVDWRKKVDRTELSESLQKSLRSLLTVSRIKEQDIREILALIGEEGSYPSGQTSSPPSPPPQDPWSPDKI